jgi:hypothetical protein
MRGVKRHRSARIITAGHAFVQNLRRGHYELATYIPARHGIGADAVSYLMSDNLVTRTVLHAEGAQLLV